MGTCSQAQCTHDFKGDLQVGTVRGTGRVEALSLVLRRHCLAGDLEGREAGSRETNRPGCPTPTTQCSHFSSERPATPQSGSLWLAGTYLAVRGADRKPNVGGNHHGEGRGQLNSEATAWGGQEDNVTGALCVALPTPRGHRSLARTFCKLVVDGCLSQMTIRRTRLCCSQQGIRLCS